MSAVVSGSLERQDIPTNIQVQDTALLACGPGHARRLFRTHEPTPLAVARAEQSFDCRAVLREHFEISEGGKGDLADCGGERPARGGCSDIDETLGKAAQYQTAEGAERRGEYRRHVASFWRRRGGVGHLEAL